MRVWKGAYNRLPNQAELRESVISEGVVVAVSISPL